MSATLSSTANAGTLIVKPPPMTVHAAVAAVMAELPAIGKGNKSPEGYTYRGIEAITKHLQPLLAKHGVVIVPKAKVLDTVPSPAMKDGWQDVTMRVQWRIYGPDGSYFEAVTHGIGRDRSDKGSNKAQTQAYKYLLLHLFCIADAKDDPDSHKYESGRAPEVVKMPAAAAKSRLLELTGGDKEAAHMAWNKAGLADRRQVTEAEVEAAVSELRQLAWTWAPHGDGPGPGGKEPEKPASAGGVELDKPPGPAPGPTVRDVAMKAGHVFRDAYDAAAPRTKTRTVDRLRHALVYACTNGEHASLNDLDTGQLLEVANRLEDINAGELAYKHDQTPTGGVTFTYAAGYDVTVLWTDIEPEEK